MSASLGTRLSIVPQITRSFSPSFPTRCPRSETPDLNIAGLFDEHVDEGTVQGPEETQVFGLDGAGDDRVRRAEIEALNWQWAVGDSERVLKSAD